MIFSPDVRLSEWQPLAGGAWLFHGQAFDDERGYSHEICDLTSRPDSFDGFVPLQENLIATHAAGCARGLHFQVAPYAQAKLVTVVEGRAQFFWVSLRDDSAFPRVHSLTLSAATFSLFTPADSAHGFIALEDGTQFLLKMSAPVSLAHRGEINFLAKSLAIDFVHPLREDLLSLRDRAAPEWTMRRRSTAR